MAQALSSAQVRALGVLNRQGYLNAGNEQGISLATVKALQAKGFAEVKVSVRTETVNNSRDPFRGAYTRTNQDWTAKPKEI